ncbi:hypothetical protein BDW69DRAFT_187493 [Aspergillus filifer]
MPFLHKFTSPLFRSRSSPSRETDVAYSPLSQNAQVQMQTQTQAKARTIPAQQSPEPKTYPASTVQIPEPGTQTQFIYEDINPPAGLEHLTQTLSTPHSTTNLHSQSTPTSTMLRQQTSSAPSTPSPHLPPYNDVSGAVIVDTQGYPRFLTPQEQQERENTLQKAVHERMMGLPRGTEFSWEAQGGQVLPRYEAAPLAGGEGEVGGEKR